MHDRDDQQTTVRCVAAFIVFATFCQCAGWTLSLLHALNRTGYTIVFLVGAAATLAWWFRNDIQTPAPNFPRLKRRFTRAFPAAFLILAALAILGGFLHAPNNYDAHSYRTPRVLHWLAEGRWHWIHTHFGNLNTRGAGI